MQSQTGCVKNANAPMWHASALRSMAKTVEPIVLECTGRLKGCASNRQADPRRGVS